MLYCALQSAKARAACSLAFDARISGFILKQVVRYCSSDPKLNNIPVERIRNFSIIAHVDHGKSTLADRILEICGAVDRNHGSQQILDNLEVEKNRGITVKAQTASLIFKHNAKPYLFNLIDTPGHVDFSNEVARSLTICNGCILLVDANHGVQAQTIANYNIAKSQNLAIVPVLNKIDLKNAQPEKVCMQLNELFGIDPNSVLKISAKLGTGVEDVLEAITRVIPPPVCSRDATFVGQSFDGWFNRYRGALNLIYIRSGKLTVGDEVKSLMTGKSYEVRTLSHMRPHEDSVESLIAGQIGLVGCNMRTSDESKIGDIFVLKGDSTAESSFEKYVNMFRAIKPQPMVYAGIYPVDQSQYAQLKNAIEKLCLNDSSVKCEIDKSIALGLGWRLGFLGLLHLDVFCQRLKLEYNTESVLTMPSITYKVKLNNPKEIKQNNGENIKFVNNPNDLDDNCGGKNDRNEYFEPVVIGTILAPEDYYGQIMSLCMEHRGTEIETKYFEDGTVVLKYYLPLAEIIFDFNDKLKSMTSGFGSFSYVNHDYVAADIRKLKILLNGTEITELSRIIHFRNSDRISRYLVQKLAELLPRQMIQIKIQAVCNAKILASDVIKPFRKDVTAKLYGGDVTRRKKLLKQQADGKKKMLDRVVGQNVRIPNEVFINLLKK